MFNKLAIPFALLLLLVIGMSRSNPQNKAAVIEYHQGIKRLVESIPVDRGDWIGQEVPIPQSATSLLDPNAMVARFYTNVKLGLSATLLVLHCKDARDMAGHYPPQCYPANGWLTPEDDQELTMIPVDGQDFRVYRFHRVAGKVERDITVYSMFALPTGMTTMSMKDVRRLSSDYENRLLGAAQIQVVIDGSVDPSEHAWILDEMYKIAAPTVEAVQSPAINPSPDDGSNR
jgi:hypothetical protein